jgi:hypothetical protein
MMKRSSRILIVCAAACFAFVTGWILSYRLLYRLDPPAAGLPESPAPGRRPGPGPNPGPAPQTGVSWRNLTLGLRKTGGHGVDESRSLFRDIPLYSCDFGHIGSYRFAPGNLFTPDIRRTLYFGFRADPPASGGWSDWRKTVSVLIQQTGPVRSSMDSLRLGMIRLTYRVKPFVRRDGVIFYWCNGDAVGEWAGSGWWTKITVPLESCGRDSARTDALRGKICERIIAYYAALK